MKYCQNKNCKGCKKPIKISREVSKSILIGLKELERGEFEEILATNKQKLIKQI